MWGDYLATDTVSAAVLPSLSHPTLPTVPPGDPEIRLSISQIRKPTLREISPRSQARKWPRPEMQGSVSGLPQLLRGT